MQDDNENTSGNDLDAIVEAGNDKDRIGEIINSPATVEDTKRSFEARLKAHDDAIASISKGNAPTESKYYGGEIDPNRPVYIGRSGELTYNAPSAPAGAGQIGGPARLSPVEVAGRNQTDQFFASAHGIATQEDAKWAAQFPNGPAAQRVAARDTRWSQLFPGDPVAQRIQSNLANGRAAAPASTLSVSSPISSTGPKPPAFPIAAKPSQSASFTTPPLNYPKPPPFSQVQLNLRPDRIYQQPNNS